MNFHLKHSNATKSRQTASSVLTSPNFLTWCRKNIYPNIIHVDTDSRERVML